MQIAQESASNDKQKAKINLDTVSVRFQSAEAEVIALDRVDLEVYENEFLCIMGPSGCGKTTLLNAIAGMQKITDGEIKVNGRSVSAPGPDRAVVFQADAVFPWMTVEENIAFSQKAQGKSKAEVQRTVDKYIGLVHLQDFRKAWPKQLSGGMRKRVDIARAYAADPDVLLLDEPFGPLDIMTKEYLQEELRKLWMEAPRMIIFITHDLEEALYLGDRVAIMTPRPGRIHSIYKPGFSRERDMSIKTTDEFIEYRRQIRKIFKDHE